MKPEYLAPHSIRLAAGTILPGCLSISPLYFLVYSRFSWISTIVELYPWAIVVFLVSSSYLAGLFVASIGCAIEECLVSKEYKGKKYKNMQNVWYEYLRNGAAENSPGHKYIGLSVTWLKFYTSMIPALVLFLAGLATHEFYWNALSCHEFWIIIASIIVAAVWFSRRATTMIKELHELRQHVSGTKIAEEFISHAAGKEID